MLMHQTHLNHSTTSSDMSSHTSGHSVPSACYVCQVQQVETYGSACSRRCGWVSRCACPQCGRGRYPTAIFCSAGCAAESRQANWCVACGVRQLAHGAPSCGAAGCVAAVQQLHARGVSSSAPPVVSVVPVAAPVHYPATYSRHQQHHQQQQQHYAYHHHQPQQQQQQYLPHHHHQQAYHPHAYNNNNNNQQPHHHQHHHRRPVDQSVSNGPVRLSSKAFAPHVPLPLNDKVAVAVRHQLGVDAGSVLAIVKVGGSSEDRKEYTAYRCRVESELNEFCGVGATKYGHGGEGNEHRRYIPLRSECGASCVDGKPCGFATCQVCCLLDRGVKSAVGRQMIASWSHAKPAVDAINDASTSSAFVAVAVCRVTVGRPGFNADGDDGSKPSAVMEQHHSSVVQCPGYDVAYVPGALPSVDPLFVVVLASH